MRARDNPFSTDRILLIRYRLQGTTWEALLDRFISLGFRAAVTGAHGAGKTTLLEDLEIKLSERGFVPKFIRLNASSARQEKRDLLKFAKTIGSKEFLILDGAEQLNPIEWRRLRWLSRHAGGLLISLHRPARLPALWHCRTDPRLLEKIVAEIAPSISESRDFHALFRRHDGNLREALRELYDECAGNGKLFH